MRFHRIRLTNFRGVTDAEVSFAASGVTIVEGDNEVGKSSLGEAIDLLLAERDDSSKRRVRAVKPVDRDAGAEVELEFSTGPYRIRYRKRWHRQKETVLDVLAPERAHLTGRAAHDRVQAILAETVDAALWEALRLRQGEPLTQGAFAGGSLGRALDRAAGSESAGEREDDLWERIAAERDRYWTPTGQPKAERAAAERGFRAAEARVETLEARLRELEQDAAEVERLDRRHHELSERRVANERTRRELEEAHDRIERLRREVERLRGQRDTADAEHQRAEADRRHRRGLVDAVDRAMVAVATLEAQERDRGPARAGAEARRRAAHDAYEAAERALREADAAHRGAIADRDHRRQEIERAQLAERCERVRVAMRERDEADALLEEHGVDDDMVGRIEAAYVALKQAEAAVESGAATIDATALADVTIEIDGADVALGSGDHRAVPVTDRVRVEVPGLLRLWVRAGPEAQSLAERLGATRAAYEAVCEVAGVKDLAEARHAAAARVEAERTATDATRAIERDLRDLTLDALAQKAGRLAARIEAFRCERADDPPLPPDLDAAQLVAAERERAFDACREEVERRRRERDEAAAVVQDADLGDARVQAQIELAHGNLSQAETTLAAARAEAGDDEVDAAVASASRVLEARAGDLAAAEAALAAADPETVEARLDNARGVHDRLDGELRDVDGARRELRAALAARGDEGLAHELDRARTELERCALAHERLEVRAAAAQRLHDAFAARRTEAHHRYVAPFRERIEQLGRLVFGSDFEVELGDDLTIVRRTLDGVTLEFDHLSTGAQEQLGIIARLACASIVAPDGGAPVIFDDALGWTDPHRLDRMGAVIATAGRTCQVVVLTCTPGRYESVGHATVVRLPAVPLACSIR